MVFQIIHLFFNDIYDICNINRTDTPFSFIVIDDDGDEKPPAGKIEVYVEQLENMLLKYSNIGSQGSSQSSIAEGSSGDTEQQQQQPPIFTDDIVYF